MAARSRQVALLRGINVGKAKRVAMADLRALLEELGYGDVATLLQSGNAVYSTQQAPASAAKRIAGAIAERFGFEVPVIVRTAEEVAHVVGRNPLADVANDGARHLVAFLSADPDPVKIASLLGVDLGDDRVVHEGREIYLWCPRGVLDSAGAKLLTDRTLDVTVTTRNWNTVEKLHALLSG